MKVADRPSQGWDNHLQMAIPVGACITCCCYIWLHPASDGILFYSYNQYLVLTLTSARIIPFHWRLVVWQSNRSKALILLVNDNKELVSRASVLLVRMCGVTPPPSLINPLLDSMFVAIQSSPVGNSVPRVTRCSYGRSLGELEWKLCHFYKVRLIEAKIRMYWQITSSLLFPQCSPDQRPQSCWNPRGRVLSWYLVKCPR